MSSESDSTSRPEKNSPSAAPGKQKKDKLAIFDLEATREEPEKIAKALSSATSRPVVITTEGARFGTFRDVSAERAKVRIRLVL
jgi:hypothetical protein